MTPEKKIDKSKWGAGPWQEEPDRIEWTSKGMPCLMVRGPMGQWCGYVAVLPGHPWHGIGYSECAKGCRETKAELLQPVGRFEVPESIQKRHLARKHFSCEEDYTAGHRPESIINVHGGLTYSGFCQGDICHVPKPGEPDNVFWFGFDCAHGGDVCPKYAEIAREVNHAFSSFLDGKYRNVAYVKAQVESLASQLKKLQKVGP